MFSNYKNDQSEPWTHPIYQFQQTKDGFMPQPSGSNSRELKRAKDCWIRPTGSEIEFKCQNTFTHQRYVVHGNSLTEPCQFQQRQLITVTIHWHYALFQIPCEEVFGTPNAALEILSRFPNTSSFGCIWSMLENKTKSSMAHRRAPLSRCPNGTNTFSKRSPTSPPESLQISSYGWDCKMCKVPKWGRPVNGCFWFS